ncbi:Cation efflux family protein [compost metagenome]
MHHWVASKDVEPDELANIRQILRTAVEKGDMVQDVHNIRARKTADGIIVNFHCRVSPAASIVAAHDAVDRIERQLRALYPTISRAVGHVEPIKPAL